MFNYRSFSGPLSGLCLSLLLGATPVVHANAVDSMNSAADSMKGLMGTFNEIKGLIPTGTSSSKQGSTSGTSGNNQGSTTEGSTTESSSNNQESTNK